ncbi:CLUMA_CG008692, isoform A [Clunio marinus]|uniref:CLUMA_CG008692, isoform A n=1 Tax=Clunio marinus TaxID=568069 RepID=A0A1J1I6F1_9DIPT|nr:CLUMA_CG008692, isoform A [Clunio marinus]
MSLIRALQPSLISPQIRLISSTCVLNKNQSGRYKVTPKKDRPLTYEQSNPPHQIGHRKAWNSWNVANLKKEKPGVHQREPQMITEDFFIRKFMTATFHGIVCSEVIIKRQFNLIRVAFIMSRQLPPRKMYFLIGYTEELLSYWLQCPVTLEINTVADKRDVIYKYI